MGAPPRSPENPPHFMGAGQTPSGRRGADGAHKKHRTGCACTLPDVLRFHGNFRHAWGFFPRNRVFSEGEKVPRGYVRAAFPPSARLRATPFSGFPGPCARRARSRKSRKSRKHWGLSHWKRPDLPRTFRRMRGSDATIKIKRSFSFAKRRVGMIGNEMNPLYKHL